MKEKLTFVDFWLYVMFISLAVSPAFTLGEGGRNLLLIGVMSVSPLVIIRYPEFDRNDFLLLIFVIAIILLPMLRHPETLRWSTIVYSVMFCLNFMAFSRLLRYSSFNIQQYFVLIRWLIYAYAVVLVIQQFCVLVGLPVFNLSNYDPKDPWKLNSLTSEPSNSARILGLLMYCYILVKEQIENREYKFRLDFKADKWVWISFSWTILTMGSGTAIVFMIIVLLKFLRFKALLPFFVLAGIIFGVANFKNIKSVQRTVKVVEATLSFDEHTVMKTDGSAGSRIIPLMTLPKIVTIATVDGWLGHGIDQVSKRRLMDYREFGYKDGLTGSLLTLWYEYGFVAFLLFICFCARTCLNKRDMSTLIFLFMLVFLYGINNQIVWVCIVLLYTNKIFLNANDEKNYSYCSWKS